MREIVWEKERKKGKGPEFMTRPASWEGREEEKGRRRGRKRREGLF